MSRRKPKLPTEPVEVRIEDLSHDGQGVAHIDGKTVFINGALQGERVRFVYTARRRDFDKGEVQEILEASPDRIDPRCPHFGLCGGCSLQHLSSAAQIAAKQDALLQALKRIGHVEPEEVYAPLLNAEPWGYRRKARLGARYVRKKERVLVGFREKRGNYVADMDSCEVLHPKVGTRIDSLAELIQGLSIREQVPQIEMAMDDEQAVLALRVMTEPSASDLDALRAYAAANDVIFYLQPGGPDSLTPLDQPVELAYRLPDQDLRFVFGVTDFTQVNFAMNRRMINRASELLDPKPNDHVLDLFCGIGNFTLPLAQRAERVVGVEGDGVLVGKARANAEANGLGNVDFHVANLYEPVKGLPWVGEHYDQVLLDPPRSGAQEILEHLPRTGAKRVLYISCYPGTLARDAGELVNQHGYRLLGAGVMDMFPHTAHVESIALFERN